jgi:putative transposase
MVGYRRNFVSGGTYFFTVVLEDRRSSLLVDKIASLRHAFRVTRAGRPFKIDAIVVLPDHLHMVMTLPEGDSDFSGRWRGVKSVFSRQVVAEGVPAKQNRRESTRFGKDDSGSTRSVTKPTSRGTSTTYITIQSSTPWYRA